MTGRPFGLRLDFEAAMGRLNGVTLRTDLVPLPSPSAGLRVFGKLENRQVGRAFKARGAWNNLVQWTPEERAAGVVAASSGNHGLALAWAAQALEIPCILCMPAETYPSKVEGCRAHGAEVRLFPTRPEAEAACDALANAGAQRVHGYDAERTIEGAGTVGHEIAQQSEPADFVLIPIGGGGLSSGTSLALRRAWGDAPEIWGVEPEGAAGMRLGIEAGHSVPLPEIQSQVQGLLSPYAGERNVQINRVTLNGIRTLSDERIAEGAERLMAAGEIVEPAGAAAYAALWEPGNDIVERARTRTGENPLTAIVIVSGGNRPDAAEAHDSRESGVKARNSNP